MDDYRFDQLARSLGSRLTRRQSMIALAGVGALAMPVKNAAAGTVCPLFCPVNAEFFDTSGTCSLPVSFGDPAISKGCEGENFSVSCSHDSGDSFPVGTTTVTCNSIDPTSGCSFTVTIFDGNPISATCPADMNVDAAEPTSVTFGPVMVGTVCTPNTGQANCDHDSGDVFPLGTTTVTCSVPQGAAGPSGGCSFNISLAPAPTTATPTNTPTEDPVDPTATTTEAPATTAPTTVPGDPTATEVPATIAPTTVPGDPTATMAPVTELPNTGAGDGGSGTASKLLPIAAVGAGAALLARLGIRRTAAANQEPTE